MTTTTEEAQAGSPADAPSAGQPPQEEHPRPGEAEWTGEGLELPADSVVAAATLSAENRRKWAKSGVALPDGSFPIPDCSFVGRAVHRIGSSNHPVSQVKAHIIRRAKALGCTGDLPDGWLTAALEPEWLTAAMGAPSGTFLPERPLDGPTPFTVADDLTTDGHLALWASCHTGYPGCVRPPREEDFPAFNLGEVVTADGRRVSVGKVTIGTGHAGSDLTALSAAAHYDNTGTQVVVAHAVADKWGIRMPGAVIPGVGEGRVDELRRSPLSGDWRKIDGRLRLIAALAVNVPGFPIPRALVAAGDTDCLIMAEDWGAPTFEAEADALMASIGIKTPAQAAEELLLWVHTR